MSLGSSGGCHLPPFSVPPDVDWLVMSLGSSGGCPIPCGPWDRIDRLFGGPFLPLGRRSLVGRRDRAGEKSGVAARKFWVGVVPRFARPSPVCRCLPARAGGRNTRSVGAKFSASVAAGARRPPGPNKLGTARRVSTDRPPRWVLPPGPYPGWVNSSRHSAS